MQSCNIQAYTDGAWHDAASVKVLGNADQGWRAKTYAGYGVEWAFEHSKANDAHAATATWPVGLEPLQLEHWPVFLIDMLPQGLGRQQLLRRLGHKPNAEATADWPSNEARAPRHPSAH